MEKITSQLVTTKQLAKELGVSIQLLQGHRFNGRGLPYYKRGAAVLYDLEECRRIWNESLVRVEPAPLAQVGKQVANV
jgi:hypothetical protein